MRDRGNRDSRNPRHWLAWWGGDRRMHVAIGLMVVGGLVFFQHLVSHMGFFEILGGGADDLLVGYPTAAVLVVTGLFMLGGDDKSRSRR